MTDLAPKITRSKETVMVSTAIEEMDAAEIREVLKTYIRDVEPNNADKQMKAELIADIDGGVTHNSQAIKTFLINETIIANETGDTRIFCMLETLIEIDRKAA